METTITPTPEAMNEETPTSVPVIPQSELIRASLNTPADQFTLGKRVFNIVDLPYDDYLEFIGHLTPLIEVLAKRVADKSSVSVPGIELRPEMLNPQNLIQVCGKILPQMVCIMCRQTDPNITVAEIKKLVNKPYPLAYAIIKQVQQNNMLKDFTDFFALTMGMMKGSKLLN